MPPETNTLQTIQNLGAQLKQHCDEIAQAEAKVKRLKEVKRELEEVTLPTLMNEIGITGLDLAGGGKISVLDLVATRIPAGKETAAFDWLRETNNDGIIKNQITVMLDRGQDERAERVKEDLTTRGITFDHKQSIHPATLKSFVTEALTTAGLQDTLPKELFGVYECQKVVFK
jgi:hypothetical protein